MTKIFLNGVLLCLLTFGVAREPAQAQLIQPNRSASEIYAALEKLDVLGSVLYFAAHPDDENTRLIAWLAHEKKYRTAYLSLTRGDGGQNLIGTELAEELGLIRTQELLLARQLDGGEQYFSRANDFGFSKTAEETLAFWEKDSMLADAVWMIRKLRPDVIITRFPADERGGHGHHQAATQLAIEAFSAAADPAKFPEQLAYGVTPWQAKRILWNTANFGGQNNTSPDQFQVDAGGFNPLLGRSYGEIAAESRSSHKTQGFGAALQRGSSIEFFETLAGSEPREDLMDGVRTTWDRVPGASAISGMIRSILKKYDMRRPDAVLPDLLALLESLEALPDHQWKTQKIAELKDIILACAGIWFESYAEAPRYAVGDEVVTRTEFIVRQLEVHVRIHQIEYLPNGRDAASFMADDMHTKNQASGKDEEVGLLQFNQLRKVPGSFIASKPTQPYWLRAPRHNERYAVSSQEDIGQPGNQDDPIAWIRLSVNGKTIQYTRPIIYKHTHPVHGEQVQPLSIAPRVTANVREQALVFANGAKKSLDVVFTSHSADQQEVSVVAQAPAGWVVTPAQVELSFSAANQEQTQRFVLGPERVNASNPLTPPAQLRFLWQSTTDEKKASMQEAQMVRTIDHPHIPLLTHYPTAAVGLSELRAEVPVRRIGYLPGAGDLVPEALRQIGIDVDLLDEKDIFERDLSLYDAIITGVRAYNVHPRMPLVHNRLMDYVAKGGTYLVQYQVNTSLQTEELGPYPFQLSRLRVTDERAPVRFALPESSVLNYPNRITAADFDGWIQERGLYFVADADPSYQKPLSMNDPGEPPLDGALLVTQHGKGRFVYTSLAFFRQLPAGVPGAFRLFMNLLAKPENQK